MEQFSKLLELTGKKAIVTGGAKGIGYGIVYRLAEAGANVLIADTDESAVEKSVSEFKQKKWSVEGVVADVSKEEDVKKIVSLCIKKFNKLDILVNNAGIYPPKPVADMTENEFEKVMNVNLRSCFLTTKYASAEMRKQNGGKIINITSIDALHPSMIGLAHYDASKHGMWGFTKNSALELAEHKIWVNAIAPGGIATPGVAAMSQGASVEQMEKTNKAFIAKIPMHRIGEPDEIGKVALFLASDMSSYMTGSQIIVDGGALLS